MEHKRRDTIVGLFAFISLLCFSWMVFKFGDLPGFVSKMDANQIKICFPEVPGIQENSAVYFRGFSVGKVIEVMPPALRPGRAETAPMEFNAIVVITIAKNYQIPDNITPKIFQRGLGSSYIELSLPAHPSDSFLTDGSELFGVISEGSQFISETTQQKLDNLIESLDLLSQSVRSQLNAITPEDADNENKNINANLTTAIMRFDETLRNLNTIIGNPDNQANIANMISELSQGSTELRGVIAKADKLADRSDQVVNNIDTQVTRLSDSFAPLGEKTQVVADELATALKSFNTVMLKAVDGEGTIDRLLNDPKLYESLTDTSARLSLALEEMKKLINLWKEKGVDLNL